MKAATKTILFCRVTVDKHPHLYPVAVFANDKTAKAFTSLLMMAHKTGNADLAKSLDSQVRMAADGTLVPGARFSIKIVDYEPVLIVPDADDVPTESSATL